MHYLFFYVFFISADLFFKGACTSLKRICDCFDVIYRKTFLHIYNAVFNPLFGFVSCVPNS